MSVQLCGCPGCNGRMVDRIVSEVRSRDVDALVVLRQAYAEIVAERGLELRAVDRRTDKERRALEKKRRPMLQQPRR